MQWILDNCYLRPLSSDSKTIGLTIITFYIMVRLENRTCKSPQMTFTSHTFDFSRPGWRHISKWITSPDISLVTLERPRWQQTVKKYFVHLVLSFLSKKIIVCLNKRYKVWHFHDIITCSTVVNSCLGE